MLPGAFPLLDALPEQILALSPFHCSPTVLQGSEAEKLYENQDNYVRDQENLWSWTGVHWVLTAVGSAEGSCCRIQAGSSTKCSRTRLCCDQNFCSKAAFPIPVLGAAFHNHSFPSQPLQSKWGKKRKQFDISHSRERFRRWMLATGLHRRLRISFL